MPKLCSALFVLGRSLHPSTPRVAKCYAQIECRTASKCTRKLHESLVLIKIVFKVDVLVQSPVIDGLPGAGGRSWCSHGPQQRKQRTTVCLRIGLRSWLGEKRKKRYGFFLSLVGTACGLCPRQDRQRERQRQTETDRPTDQTVGGLCREVGDCPRCGETRSRAVLVFCMPCGSCHCLRLVLQLTTRTPRCSLLRVYRK